MRNAVAITNGLVFPSTPFASDSTEVSFSVTLGRWGETDNQWGILGGGFWNGEAALVGQGDLNQSSRITAAAE